MVPAAASLATGVVLSKVLAAPKFGPFQDRIKSENAVIGGVVDILQNGPEWLAPKSVYCP